VATYNHHALHREFTAEQIVNVSMGTNATELSELGPWLRRDHFHELRQVALGARVALTSNIALDKSAANGATGEVVAIDFQDEPEGGWERSTRAISLGLPRLRM